MPGVVVERYRYPIKGCGAEAIPHDELMHFDEFGVQGSRQMMLIDEDGSKVTLRERAGRELVRIRPRWTPEGVVINDSIQAFAEPDAPIITNVDIFGDTVSGRECHERASKEVNQILGTTGLRLIQLDRSLPPRVPTPEKPWKGTAPRAFVDGAQIHIVNRQTIHLMKLQYPCFDADARRFRPDIVVDTSEPEAELQWVGHPIQISRHISRVTRLIDRCNVPGKNPSTGVMDTAVIRMLSEYHRHQEAGGKVVPCVGVAADLVLPYPIRHGDPFSIQPE